MSTSHIITMVEGKIKGKDLQFDKNLPPFLQRLHAQKGGFGDADRHERAIARPKKAKDEEDDDGPTMIDETGETLTKDEYKKLTRASPTAAEESNNVATSASETRPGNEEPPAAKLDAKVTNGATSKKRKAAKIVGESEEPEAQDAASVAKSAKKPKKKAKAVKLAFDDTEEGT
ncbi:uncharacterized protein RCC_09335 [Ramularia collo-cygni]|uniref:DUF4604 domain-containing protein n=1 Tax=Ramularia collo-cygni TaxID=112498 RepID=A0A2D3VHD8_9PEZI|nr:uncharacterized protein RCC_09335 [Ramularia collo-cygni]CZT23621.1 uncharacterized protein RCC_09335 [Ramularia collo-cygni]